MNEPYKTHSEEYKGCTIRVACFYDSDNTAPWDSDAGHGPVSDWRPARSKAPGELILCTDRHGGARLYDYTEARAIPERDGWGIGAEREAELIARLGRPPTRKEILHEAVMVNYTYLKRWCEDDWWYIGYQTTVSGPDGETVPFHYYTGGPWARHEVEEDSCWAFDSDSEDYMISEALSNARHAVDNHLQTRNLTELATCWP